MAKLVDNLMFDNIIGQERIVERLRMELLQGLLPKSLLFTGENFSGRLTTAFELARIVTCKNDGVWKCGCSHCKQQRLLYHPKLIYLGHRNFMLEIRAALAFCQRSSDDYIARLMLLRSVNKLISRFNIVVASALEDRIKKVAKSLSTLKELTIGLYKEEMDFQSILTNDWCENLLKHCQKIEEALPKKISVEEIRAINVWAHSCGSDPRVVIIEGVDDLNLSCANALLKILEEPPKGLVFVLLATRRGAVLPTILSRSRIYDFENRITALQQEVISQIFREKDFGIYQSVKEYLYGVSGIKIKEYQRAAQFVLSQIVDGQSYPQINMEEVLTLSGTKTGFELFLEQLSFVISNLEWDKSDYITPLNVLSNWNNYIREALIMNKAYNQKPESLLESLFYRMRKASRLTSS